MEKVIKISRLHEISIEDCIEYEKDIRGNFYRIFSYRGKERNSFRILKKLSNRGLSFTPAKDRYAWTNFADGEIIIGGSEIEIEGDSCFEDIVGNVIGQGFTVYRFKDEREFLKWALNEIEREGK